MAQNVMLNFLARQKSLVFPATYLFRWFAIKKSDALKSHVRKNRIVCILHSTKMHCAIPCPNPQTPSKKNDYSVTPHIILKSQVISKTKRKTRKYTIFWRARGVVFLDCWHLKPINISFSLAAKYFWSIQKVFIGVNNWSKTNYIMCKQFCL